MERVAGDANEVGTRMLVPQTSPGQTLWEQAEVGNDRSPQSGGFGLNFDQVVQQPGPCTNLQAPLESLVDLLQEPIGRSQRQQVIAMIRSQVQEA